MQTKKLTSLGHRGKSLKHKGRDTRRGWSTAGQDRIRPRQAPSGTQGREPQGEPGPERRVRPGAEFSMETEGTGARRSGSSGTNGGHRAAAHFSPGAFGLGEVHPHGRTGQGGFSRQVGRAVRGPGGPERRASGAQPPAPESTFDASPAPHDKMATWAEGEPGPRGWGKERGGEKRQKQKGGPRNAEAGPRARAAGGQGRRRRTRPAEGTALLFLVVRAAGALHGESVPATPSRPAAPRLAPA